jgi:N4-gp56 family major capsid protein
MATTTYSPSISADVSRYLAEDLLPLTINELIFHEFSEKLRLPKGNGTTYTMTRYARLPLAYSSTAEGVPPVATPLKISQATVALQQWTALVTITDVAQATIKHDVFKIAKERLTLAAAELMERNCINALFAFPQINYVNSKGARASLAATDVLNTQELQRAFAYLNTLGVPMFKGPSGPKVVKKAGEGQPDALSSPRNMPHFVAAVHPMVQADLRNNPSVQLVSAYSSPNRLYNGEFGEWNQMRFVTSNFIPSFLGGGTSPTGTGVATGGTLANGNFQIVVTGTDQQTQFESIIYTQSGNIATGGSTGSITLTTPTTAGYLWTVYITAAGGTVAANLATCAAGPTQGALQGMATQLPGGTAIVLTGIGVAKTPPAAPGSAITVYPTFIFGKDAYATVTLEDIEVNYLDRAEKTDPANQLRMASFKFYNGTFVKNAAFSLRIESASQFSMTLG